MKALIFAAGFGERMRPLTEHTPKPLLSVGGTPLIVWHLRKLAALGVDEVVINTSWLAAQFPQVLGDGSAFGLRLTYSYEGSTPLETGGGMLHALPLLVDAPAYAARADFALTHEGKISSTAMPTLTYAGIGLYRPALLHAWERVIGPLPSTGEAPPRFPWAPILRAQMAAGRIDGVHHRGRWTDVGTPQRLAELDAQLTQRRD